jgi:putative hydrolase of the HAD superfamily
MIFKGILFDLFGTIIPRPDRGVHDKMMKDMGQVLGMGKDEFRTLWLSLHQEKTTWNEGDTNDLMMFVIQKCGKYPERDLAERMTNIWNIMTRSHFKFFEDVVPAFRELKKLDKRIGLLTNCGPNVPEIVENSEIVPFIDGAVYSSRVGLRKPEPEIYHLACRKIRTRPGETIFIGDGDSNELEGAKKAGLSPIKIERGEIAGDYRLTEEPDWKPMIGDLNDVSRLVQSL